MLSLARCGRLPRRLQPRARICNPFSSCTGASTDDASRDADDGERVHDAIIVGGGPTGLLLSALLSSYDVKSHLLFDKRPVDELLRHPQAHFVNVRSMEILKGEVPQVYRGVLEAMPDVEEWEAFHFGGSVMGNEDRKDGWGGRRLGRVVHPVREPLRVRQSGDAILVPRGEANSKEGSGGAATEEVDAPAVSLCRPAHLAQNKFVSLLLEEARRHFDESDTSKGRSYRTRYLLSADGVHSFVRKHFGIPMLGDDSIQNLINVHFRTNDGLSELLMRKSDQAMLHFVYNAQLVGAFVCHDGRRGEWVLQVPFFPPFQTVEDFDQRNVREMIWAGLGVPLDIARESGDLGFDILSIRPWTMSSLVAQSYVSKSKNMALVGDAAHAFPPAGGFGMNTGLQDAHNLAWRLALALNRETNEPSSFGNNLLSKYDEERRPVASQNAALSVRNYQRTLRLAKACYLDAQHPQLLISMLGAPPMSFLPLEARQDMFRRLVNVAMMPLGSLVSSSRSFHAEHIEKNVRSILESGGSLPLVFPRYELGFSYSIDAASAGEISDDGAGDTAGYVPRLEVGHRMPHVMVEVLGSSDSCVKRREVVETLSDINSSATAMSASSNQMSLTDISSQMRRAKSYQSPLFTVVAFGPALAKSSKSLVEDAVNCSARKWNVKVMLVKVLFSKLDGEHPTGRRAADPLENDTEGITVAHALDTERALLQLLHDEQSSSHEKDNFAGGLVLMRPDGHIANASTIEENGDEAISGQVQQFIDQGLRNALGGVPEN
ncbi:hypothetical protein ACHAXT_012832 [Thalassiosira profunda]